MIDFDTISLAINAEVDAEIAGNGALPIGEIITTLSVAPDLPVKFAPSGNNFGEVHSYRGFYRLPAVSTGEEVTTARDVGAALTEAIDGRTFYGWKGGDYAFNRTMPLFHANRGDTSGMAVTSIEVTEDAVLLHCGRVYE